MLIFFFFWKGVLIFNSNNYKPWILFYIGSFYFSIKRISSMINHSFVVEGGWVQGRGALPLWNPPFLASSSMLCVCVCLYVCIGVGPALLTSFLIGFLWGLFSRKEHSFLVGILFFKFSVKLDIEVGYSSSTFFACNIMFFFVFFFCY